MEVKYLNTSKTLIIKITEEIDEFEVKEIRRKADYEIERYSPKKVIFDFDRVTFMDSSGIGMIIGRYKQVTMFGGKMELTNLTESVRKIFELSGILRLIPEVDLTEEFFIGDSPFSQMGQSPMKKIGSEEEKAV